MTSGALEGGDDLRARVRALAHDALARGAPAAWFEPLYRAAAGDPGQVPWADQAPHPDLLGWLAGAPSPPAGARAVVVGCGLGDDAAALAARGWDVTAFDVAPTSVDWARRRFAGLPGVAWHVADLFALPAGWARAFDLVLEAYTIQALPPSVREAALGATAGLVAPAGRAVVITRMRPDGAPGPSADPATWGPPWPVSPAELEALARAGLAPLESVCTTPELAGPGAPPLGPGAPAAPRFRSVWLRPPGSS